ncbi:MAG TPA: hypothetical protein P5110_00975 [Candidatus Omnitrophota bacterium]|nr:hypothetical protein [Candidatus Omnitrophota bacterium]
MIKRYLILIVIAMLSCPPAYATSFKMSDKENAKVPAGASTNFKSIKASAGMIPYVNDHNGEASQGALGNWDNGDKPGQRGTFPDGASFDNWGSFWKGGWWPNSALAKVFDFTEDKKVDQEDIDAMDAKITAGEFDESMDLNNDSKLDATDKELLTGVVNFNDKTTAEKTDIVNDLADPFAAAVITNLTRQPKGTQQAGEILAALETERATQLLNSDDLAARTVARIMPTMDTAEAADMLEGLDVKKAGAILMSMATYPTYLSSFFNSKKTSTSATTASSIVAAMDTEKAVAIFADTDFKSAKAAAILGKADAAKAADIMEGLDTARAAEILQSMTGKTRHGSGGFWDHLWPWTGNSGKRGRLTKQAGEILANMDPAKAAAVLADSSFKASKAGAIFKTMDSAKAAAILADDALSVDQCADILKSMGRYGFWRNVNFEDWGLDSEWADKLSSRFSKLSTSAKEILSELETLDAEKAEQIRDKLGINSTDDDTDDTGNGTDTNTDDADTDTDGVLPPATETDLSKYTDSESLLAKAWKYFDKKDYGNAAALAKEAVSRYSDKAKEQQASLSKFASESKAADYWALNDVGTAHLILGNIYKTLKDNEAARTEYKTILAEYKYAQCYDPQGWWWKVADAAREALNKLK